MKILLKIVLLFAAMLVAQTVRAQRFTQSVTIPYTGASQTTFTASLSKPTTIPCTLFLVARTLSTPTITDDAGDTWEAVGGGTVRGIWYAQCKGGATKVTITFGSPVTFYGVIGEKSGYFDEDVTSLPIDGNSNPTASATITTTSADFIIGYGWNYTTTTPTLTAGPGYVMEVQADAFIETTDQSAPGSVSSSVTYHNGWSGWWVQGIVAFKPAIPSFCTCSH